MPRKLRVWFPGAMYHIIYRGNNGSEIFRDEDDKQVYLYIIKETLEKYSFYLISYCLMSNQIHLQLETTNEAPGSILRYLNVQYIVYLKSKYNFVGHLFHGRYRDELVETDAHNLQISKNIHLKPVQANLVEHPADYLWSSYREYLGQHHSGLLTKEKIMGCFNSASPLIYQQYVENELMFKGTDGHQ